MCVGVFFSSGLAGNAGARSGRVVYTCIMSSSLCAQPQGLVCFRGGGGRGGERTQMGECLFPPSGAPCNVSRRRVLSFMVELKPSALRAWLQCSRDEEGAGAPCSDPSLSHPRLRPSAPNAPLTSQRLPQLR